jgi:hypothetical protein
VCGAEQRVARAWSIRIGVNVSVGASAELHVPPILIFTAQHNLLHANPTMLSLDGRRIRANVQSIIDRHPGANVTFYDDEACRTVLKEVQPGLVCFFD